MIYALLALGVLFFLGGLLGISKVEIHRADLYECFAQITVLGFLATGFSVLMLLAQWVCRG